MARKILLNVFTRKTFHMSYYIRRLRFIQIHLIKVLNSKHAFSLVLCKYGITATNAPRLPIKITFDNE